MFPNLFSALKDAGQTAGDAGSGGFPTPTYQATPGQNAGGGFGSQYNQMSNMLNNVEQAQQSSQTSTPLSNLTNVPSVNPSFSSSSTNPSGTSSFAPQTSAPTSSAATISNMFNPLAGNTGMTSQLPAIQQPATQQPVAQQQQQVISSTPTPIPQAQQQATQPVQPAVVAPTLYNFTAGTPANTIPGQVSNTGISYINPATGLNSGIGQQFA